MEVANSETLGVVSFLWCHWCFVANFNVGQMGDNEEAFSLGDFSGGVGRIELSGFTYREVVNI